ncbi:MAG: ClpXP protease specificity-enhancing factor [Methylococcaceae bacterium]|nr:ClpXP protease specificity-enhancing factor [Methylococcaceae bacterium]
MTSLRPYLIRSLYEWILDNSLTPYLLVNAEHEKTVVPEQFIQEGRIVLNIRPRAIQTLIIGNSEITFHARFGGVPMKVEIPVSAVLAIYAQENGKGMIFDDDDGELPPPRSSQGSKIERSQPSKPRLKVVK